MNPARLFAIVEDLRNQSAETNWFEFKENNGDPERLGQSISALANGARIADRETAYMIWGVRDGSHEITATNFQPHTVKFNGQELMMWLGQMLDPCPNLQFREFQHPDGRLVVLEIPAATTSPVTFKRVAYIRLGSATTKLSDQKSIEAALWAKLRPFAWEQGVALSFLTGDEVLNLLDYSAYFDLTKQRLPDNRSGIFERLVADRLIRTEAGERWDILNLGAMLFGKSLSLFPGLDRKAVRVIQYTSGDRTNTQRRHDSPRGFASGFISLIEFIDSLIPRNEEIGKALRTEHSLYPSIAIRELVANALIHQDLTVTGAGPMVEVFPDRIEITNPGKPLVEPSRFVDLPPRSRNEALASLMRRMGICEEQGSGVDKALTAVELFQLPPPDFRMDGESVRVTLYAPRSFSSMTPAERVRACYQHAALRYLAGHRMTNASLRDRFGLSSTNAAAVSRIIRDALQAGDIKVADPNAPKSGYVPSWA
ncbi:MAG: putative DNA binding domain-containing protein [Phenylobacterium sp.]|uniref:ATP-binding protein n=1 Tax=Phenylobacterium sp. TaxID=1871053 RepID=UPI0025FE85B5|nr:ATP-binding protein [Phenylobacterium sp.]MCA3710525.1 putative DNA binding domain-containing protein [Phenylobacterium sp.]